MMKNYYNPISIKSPHPHRELREVSYNPIRIGVLYETMDGWTTTQIDDFKTDVMSRVIMHFENFLSVKRRTTPIKDADSSELTCNELNMPEVLRSTGAGMDNVDLVMVVDT